MVKVVSNPEKITLLCALLCVDKPSIVVIKVCKRWFDLQSQKKMGHVSLWQTHEKWVKLKQTSAHTSQSSLYLQMSCRFLHLHKMLRNYRWLSSWATDAQICMETSKHVVQQWLFFRAPIVFLTNNFDTLTRSDQISLLTSSFWQERLTSTAVESMEETVAIVGVINLVVVS